MNTKYSVVGLGKLGASMAAGIAKRGYHVIGVDVNRKSVELFNSGHAPVEETDLEETISANQSRLQATLSHREAVLQSDISFVVVPTPSDERGAFSLQYAAWAFQKIGRALGDKDGYHNVVLTSTVLPGATRYGLLPILEAESGKRCGPDFGLCYSPEFIALGSVIRNFLNPDFNLVGEIDERAGSHLEQCYAEIMENQPSCQRMSFENAELTKIAVNTYVTTKITFANMLANICECLPGGNVDTVTEALGCDERIGHKYLKGALGYGGPCFPRDNLALGFLARELGERAELAEITDRVNRSHAQKIVKQLRDKVSKGTTVAVLGLSYKPFSHVVEESQAIEVVKALADAGMRVIAFDPLANESARGEIRDQAVILESVQACLQQAEVVLIATPDPAFSQLSPEDFKRREPPVMVVDFWRLLADRLGGYENIRYVPYGWGEAVEANTSRLEKLWGQQRLVSE